MVPDDGLKAQASDLLWLLRPVESDPDRATGMVAIDAPLTGEGADDVQAVMLGWITCRWTPRTAIVLDFDAGVLTWADHHSDCERATR